MLSFNIELEQLCNIDKAVEMLVYILNMKNNLSNFLISKIFYFAEKFHYLESRDMICYLRYTHNDSGIEMFDLIKLVQKFENKFYSRSTLSPSYYFIDCKVPYRKINLSICELHSIEKAFNYCINRTYGELVKETSNYSLDKPELEKEFTFLKYYNFILLPDLVE